jgi:hypothetical protein
MIAPTIPTMIESMKNATMRRHREPMERCRGRLRSTRGGAADKGGTERLKNHSIAKVGRRGIQYIGMDSFLNELSHDWRSDDS